MLSYLLIPLLLLIGAIILQVNYPTIKGAVGERHVNRLLNKLGSNYSIYHDLYIPNGKGGTTQIDHVVTSPFGIFIIETKHYQGWIFGSEHQKYWTQVIYKRKEKMFNPIWQNYGHVQALKNCIGKESSNYYNSIIAFSTNSTLKFEDDFKAARVIQFPQLIHVIKERNMCIVSDTDLQEINKALTGLMITDRKKKREVKKRHIQFIKNNRINRIQKEKENSNQSICPKCNSKLSVKNGKYGSFYGCNSFPRCRYTQKISV